MTDRLKSFVDRIARLHEERKAITADITEVVNEAKAVGYIPKTLRKVVTRYLADPAKLAEDDALLETYEAALGRVGRALQAVRAGATWDDASKAEGVPRATLARAAAVSKQREMIPEKLAAPVNAEFNRPAKSAPPADDNTTERPDAQEVGAGEARPEGTPLPRDSRATEIDLTIPPFLDKRVSA